MAKENNKTTKLTPHFTLEEMTCTDVKLGYVDNLRQTQPDEQVMENLTRVCQWLEMLRQRWNEKYGSLTPSPSPEREGRSYKEAPVIVNSAYRCKELNRLVGGCPTSNHLTGCAADLRVIGKEQLLRYVVLLLDISDQLHQDFDELLMERNPRIFEGRHITITRHDDGTYRPNFRPIHIGPGFSVDSYATEVANELMWALEGLVEER